jgi:hypothetical protein
MFPVEEADGRAGGNRTPLRGFNLLVPRARIPTIAWKA